MSENLEKLEDIIGFEKVLYNEPMSNHTTIRIGGNADILALPESVEDVIACIKYANENNIPVCVMGNGSKILVKDTGIRGIVIKLASKFSSAKIDENNVIVTSGMSLPKLCMTLKEYSLTGLEFACGIPATIGGAVYMNAGAYGSEMANVVEQVTYLDENMCIKTIEKGDLKFGYRTSAFKAGSINGIILSAKLVLQKGNKAEIESVIEENNIQRRAKQPLEYPSAGSTFKRPEGFYVGKIIDDLGLKGYRIGDAQISEKHSGFIVNRGNATSKDVIALIEKVKEEAYSKFNVKLEEEIIILGDEK